MRVCWFRHFAVAGMAVVLALGNLASRALAEDQAPEKNATPDAAENGANKKSSATVKFDPVAAAFKLPNGVRLNTQQQAAYDDLKAAKEPELRQAVDDVQNAQGSAATAQALKKVRECRAEIRKAINAILNGTALGTSKTPDQASSGSGSQGSGSSGPTAPYGGFGGYGYGGYGPGYPYPPYGNYPYGRYPYYPQLASGSTGTQGSGTTGTQGSGTTGGGKSTSTSQPTGAGGSGGRPTSAGRLTSPPSSKPTPQPAKRK